jgi:outer membrane murein-binding lipoprotein Lpp
MSKKLIAVAAAAALALTGLVAAPANASSISSVTIQHSGSSAGAAVVSHTDADDALTAATWASARNVVFGVGASYTATRTAIRFDVLTTGATPVTVTSTGGVKIATAVSVAGVALKVDAGSTTLTGATTAGSATTLTYTFYAWSTSTTAGSVVIETSGSKNTYYVKGTLGPAYNIVNVTFPASLYTGQTDGKVTYQTTDAYGNLTNADGPAITPTGFNAGSFAAATYSATTKLWSTTLGTIAGDNVALNLAVPAFDGVDYTTNGFAKAVGSAFKLVSAGSLTAQIASLTTEVASLKASVAALTTQLEASRPMATSVTKKKYNTLARKWNAANPGSRVALKK